MTDVRSGGDQPTNDTTATPVRDAPHEARRRLGLRGEFALLIYLDPTHPANHVRSVDSTPRRSPARAALALTSSSVAPPLPVMLPSAINVERAFEQVTEHWSPKVIAELNGQYVKVAKVKGEFVWHDHASEDELFLVVRGTLAIQFEDGTVTLGPGECCVVPRGVRHNPVADEECWIVLFEPAATRHTGDVVTDRTRSVAQQLA